MPFTDIDFAALVERLRALPAESEWLEFKENMADPDEIGQYVSALSNAAALHAEERGYLVWGIEDRSHNLVGTKFDLHTAVKGNQSLHMWLIGALNPDPGIQFHTGMVRNQRVAVLEIPAAVHNPVQFKGVEYIRVGSHKKRLSEHQFQAKQLYRNLDVTPFEHRIARSGLSEEEVLESLNYQSYFKLQDLPVPRAASQVIAALASDKIIFIQSAGQCVSGHVIPQV